METEHMTRGCEKAGQAGETAYYHAPAAQLLGNAGTLSPGEREQRYAPFCEKQRLKQGGN